ncbi:MAG: hypothetical protein HGN29_15000 [Asgard group archaeon]|nr:hypothetical protein [Asgard group archaeon]
MNKFFEFFKRKKFSIDDLEEMKEDIQEYQMNLRSGLRENKAKLKRIIKKGRTPSPMAVMRYKKVQLMDKQVGGLIDTIDGMMFEVEFQEAIASIRTISTDLYESLNMFNFFKEVDKRMKEVMNVQVNYTKNMDKEVKKQEFWLENLEEKTEDQRIELEEEFDYLGDELLVEFIMEDKKLVEELPNEVKEKPIVKQVIMMLEKG